MVEVVAELVEQLMGLIVDQPFLGDAVEGLMHRALEKVLAEQDAVFKGQLILVDRMSLPFFLRCTISI